MSDKIELSCGRCGSKQFILPDNPSASDTVKCARCGAEGRYGDLQQQALVQAKAEIDKVMKNAFKKWK